MSSNPEHFRDNLRDALKLKRRDARQRRQDEKRRGRKRKVEERERIRQLNQQVAELDSQLPLSQYMKGLQSQMAPLDSVRRYGPRDGKVAYGFLYGFGIGKAIVDSRLTGGGPGGERMTDEYGYRAWRDVFGLILNHAGKVKIDTNTRLFPDTINPLVWSKEKYGFSLYAVTDEGGLEKLAERLTDFYLNFKR